MNILEAIADDIVDLTKEEFMLEYDCCEEVYYRLVKQYQEV